MAWAPPLKQILFTQLFPKSNCILFRRETSKTKRLSKFKNRVMANGTLSNWKLKESIHCNSIIRQIKFKAISTTWIEGIICIIIDTIPQRQQNINKPKSNIEPRSPTLQAEALWSKPPGKPKCNNSITLNIEKLWAGGSTGWNQDCWEKYQ